MYTVEQIRQYLTETFGKEAAESVAERLYNGEICLVQSERGFADGTPDTLLVDIIAQCRKCGDIHVIKNVPYANYMQWLNGGALIQNALRFLSPDERELLKTRTCGECWGKIFGKA